MAHQFWPGSAGSTTSPHLQPPVSGLSGAVRLARQRAPAGEPDGAAGNHRPGPHSGHSGPAAGVHRRRVGPCGALPAARWQSGWTPTRPRSSGIPTSGAAPQWPWPGAGHLPGHRSPQDRQIRDRPGVRGGRSMSLIHLKTELRQELKLTPAPAVHGASCR